MSQVPLENGVMVRFDYDMLVDDVMKETSEAPTAVKNQIMKRNHAYKPVLFIIGQGQIIYGLEKVIVERHGEGTHEAMVLAKEGFGERQRELVQTIPRHQFGKEMPKVGEFLTSDGREGLVIRVGGGRVTVDFNHHLAGKDLQYRYTVREILRDPKAKAEAIVKEMLQRDAVFEWKEENLLIHTPKHLLRSPNWYQERVRLVNFVRTAYEKPIEVAFLETFQAPAPAPPPEPVVPVPAPETVQPQPQETAEPTA